MGTVSPDMGNAMKISATTRQLALNSIFKEKSVADHNSARVPAERRLSLHYRSGMGTAICRKHAECAQAVRLLGRGSLLSMYLHGYSISVNLTLSVPIC